MPIWKDTSYFGDAAPRSVADAQIQDKDGLHDDNDATEKSHDDSSLKDNGTVVQQVNTARPEINTGSRKFSIVVLEVNTATPEDLVGPSHASEDTQVEDQEVKLGNIPQSYVVPTTPYTRIHKDHPIEHVIGDVQTSVQTRRMTTSYSEQGFLKPKRVSKALSDPAWVEAIQEELLQFKLQKRQKGHILLVQIYVDDIIFGSTKKELCDEFEKLMKDKFQMSSMGELTFFLGLQVQQKKKGIFISQDKYVNEILRKYNYTDVKSASTPTDLEKPLVQDGDAADVDEHLYRSMIGSLMYLTASRPDIMFAVCACARFQVSPKTSHLLAVKRIFRYLKGKPSLGLWYSKDSPLELVAYTDSDYAGATQDRKSTTGGCQFLGNRLISWQCKKQTVVATSTTEAEYVAAASCCGQVLWIQNQLLDYGYNFMNTVIYIDNNSTICIIENPVQHSKTKHIEIRHHFIRDCNAKKLIQMAKIDTEHNVADLLTKGFDAGRFQYLVSKDALRKTKKTYSSAFTKLILRVKKLEARVKIGKARKRAKVVLSEDDEDVEDDSSKQGRKLFNAEVNKRSVVEVPSAKKKSKKEIEQERLSFAEAIRLEEQMNEEQRAQIIGNDPFSHKDMEMEVKDESPGKRLKKKMLITQGNGKKCLKNSGRKKKEIFPRKSTRGDGRSSTIGFGECFEDFDRQDVEELYRLVKEGLVLKNGIAIHMLTEKKYPLSQETITKMLNKRLEVDHESSQAFELLRIDLGLGSTSGIRACALRNFDLEDIIKKKSFTHKEEMAPMALSDSKVNNDKSCSKTCLTNYEALKKQYDDLLVKLDDTGFKAATYKRGLATLEDQIIKYREHEVLFSEEIALLKRSIGHKEYQMGLLRDELKKVKQEKEGFEFKIAKFEKSAKDLDQLLGSQITDNSKKGLGYSAVPLPHPLILNRPTPLDLSYSGLDEFKEPEFKGYGPKNSKKESNVVCENYSNETKKEFDVDIN
ncbi:putative ribonuclease H-like domain-containing protein [Tanacetum coccineum]